jgi:hypothetical protein
MVYFLNLIKYLNLTQKLIHYLLKINIMYNISNFYTKYWNYVNFYV